jgi:hypothetical protein
MHRLPISRAVRWPLTKPSVLSSHGRASHAGGWSMSRICVWGVCYFDAEYSRAGTRGRFARASLVQRQESQRLHQPVSVP